MHISTKLQEQIDIYNAFVEEEHEAERALLKVRDKRIQQLGRVEAVKEMMDEQLKQASRAASVNGHSDEPVVLQVEPVIDAEVVEEKENAS